MKKILFKASAGILIGLGILTIVNQFAIKPYRYTETMKSAAKNVNDNCPVMVDLSTRLDSASLLENRAFKYHYTLIMYPSDSITISPAQLKKGLAPGIIKNVRNNTGLAFFRDNNVTMVYSYSDREGNLLFDIEVGPKAYN